MYGGHLIALLFTAMVLAFGLLYDVPLDLPFLLITYLIPLIVYAYNYYKEIDSDRLTAPERAAHMEKMSKAYPLLISGYAGLLAAILVLYEKHLLELSILSGALLAGGILYTIFLKRLTRFVPGFKSYFVAGEWALAVTLLCAISAGRGLDASSPAIFSFVFTRVLINTVFLDLKDVRSDAREGLKTIPVVLGWDGTIRCLYLLSLISMASVLGGILMGAMPGIALVLLVFTAYEFHYLGRAEALGEGGMTFTNYAVADYEFLTWPLVVFAGLALLHCSDFFLPAALTMWIMACVAQEWLTWEGTAIWHPPGSRREEDLTCKIVQ